LEAQLAQVGKEKMNAHESMAEMFAEHFACVIAGGVGSLLPF
jgi:hypothetical protein